MVSTTGPTRNLRVEQIQKAVRIVDSLADHSDLLDEIMAASDGCLLEALPRLLSAHACAEEDGVRLILEPSLLEGGRLAPMTVEQTACFSVSIAAS